MRIVSLVPSITESLIALGARNLVGRTRYCIHPASRVAAIPVIGGTKNLDLDRILQLEPELIIANKEENTKEQVEALMRRHGVWLTEVASLRDNENFLLELGQILECQDLAKRYCVRIRRNFDLPRRDRPPRVTYLIWRKPYMTVGGDTFISHVLEKIGLHNLFGDQRRYPIVMPADLGAADVLLLSTEPFPFAEKHRVELARIFPDKPIVIVDGEAFSWFGTHAADCGAYYHQVSSDLYASPVPRRDR